MGDKLLSAILAVVILVAVLYFSHIGWLLVHG